MTEEDHQVMDVDSKVDLEATFTSDNCYFRHSGWYWASFAYLRKDGQWMGKGCTSAGDTASWEWSPGTRLKASVCFFGDHWFCDVPLQAGDTITIYGGAGNPYYEVTHRAELIAQLGSIGDASETG